MKQCSTNKSKIESGDEYITVGGENTPLVGSGLLGYREGNLWYTPDGSKGYPIRVKQALGFARRRQIVADKAATAARSVKPVFTSMAEMAADWK